MEKATPGEAKQNPIDLWEAWIDMQSSSNPQKGTLYVIGDVIVNSRLTEPTFIKRESDTDPEHELVLEVTPGIVCDEGYTVEIYYSEELQHTNQYESITIYAGGNIIARIREIEVLL